MRESVNEKLLGVALDKYPDFKCHVGSLCKNIRQMLHAIALTANYNYMDDEKLRIMMNAYALSQFRYCPLV